MKRSQLKLFIAKPDLRDLENLTKEKLQSRFISLVIFGFYSKQYQCQDLLEQIQNYVALPYSKVTSRYCKKFPAYTS